MTTQEIRGMNTARSDQLFLQEIAAQLAELNQNMSAFLTHAIVKPNILTADIDALDLEPRTQHALRRNKVSTVAELVSKSEQQLRAMRSFGPRCIRDTRKKLGTRGLSLRGEQK